MTKFQIIISDILAGLLFFVTIIMVFLIIAIIGN